jgi:hypothetical protein
MVEKRAPGSGNKYSSRLGIMFGDIRGIVYWIRK